MHPQGSPSSSDKVDADRHVIVLGDDELVLNLVTTLTGRYDYRVTVIFSEGEGAHREAIHQAAVGDCRLSVLSTAEVCIDTVVEAGLAGAYATALMDRDDAGNLQLALALREMVIKSEGSSPRVVIRMDDRMLGYEALELLGEENMFAVSETGQVAITFAAASLQQAPPGDIAVWGRRLYLTRRFDDRAVASWPIADVSSDDDALVTTDLQGGALHLNLAAHWNPYRGYVWRLLLRQAGQVVVQGGHRVRRAVDTLEHSTARLWWISAIVLFTVMTLSLVILTRYRANSVQVDGLWDAVYVLVLLTSGANPDMAAGRAIQFAHMLVILTSSLLVPVLTAALLQSIFDRREARAAGRTVQPVRGHVIIVGLGVLGIGVAEALRMRRIRVVAIEKDPDIPAVRHARALGVQVLIGDAGDKHLLRSAEARMARSLVVTVPDDMESLRILLAGNRAAPYLRTVQRVVEHGFTFRLRERLNAADAAAHTAYSVPAVAAEHFAKLITDEAIHVVIPAASSLVFLSMATVQEGSALDDASLAAASQPGLFRPVAVRREGGSVTWNPASSSRIAASDQLLMLTTKEGLPILLSLARTSTSHLRGGR